MTGPTREIILVRTIQALPARVYPLFTTAAFLERTWGRALDNLKRVLEAAGVKP